ncbi:hypothetical protein [Dactylosporangium sp. NPDC051484]|uniref:hypothetical protein n=1 Tax=Dactylosporangium sp. NPDC051484 TaxID=3154942 RepID=UPI00344C1AD4
MIEGRDDGGDLAVRGLLGDGEQVDVTAARLIRVEGERAGRIHTHQPPAEDALQPVDDRAEVSVEDVHRSCVVRPSP